MTDEAADLYEHAACGLLATAADGTVLRVNETFLAWTGLDRESLVGRRRFQDLLTAGGRIYHETHYAPLLRMQGFVRAIAVEIVCGDGSRLPVLLNSVAREGEDGEQVIGISVFDATDRREYERELVRAREQAREAEVRARELAQTLQESLIPPSPPEIPGLDVAGVYRPALRGDEVGGDFYDVFETAVGDWAVVLGDVCGKGAAAATLTALARYTTRAAAMKTPVPSAVLATLNEAILRQHPERFCTAVYARVRPTAGGARLTVASAGHPLPLLVHDGERPAELGSSGSLLGVFGEVDIDDAEVDLRPGDAVVLYTDGVTEARHDGVFFGDGGLRALATTCAGEDAAAIASGIVDEVVAFQDGLPRDDIAVVVVKVPPAS